MKFRSLLLALTVLFTLSSVNVSANSLSNSGTGESPKIMKERIAKMTPDQKQARVLEIKERVKEIKEMDKSQLSKEEKKALRSELKEMKKEAREMGPTYVYISGAGVVLIIILLIILL
jgi:hypothetical protein